MTERDAGALRRDGSRLDIGPSSLTWRGDELHVRLDEVTAPWPSRIRGHLRLRPLARPDCSVALDRHGRHRWTPLAPSSRIEVDLEMPRLHWSGHGYLDGNHGSVPLEQDFAGWQWSRALLPDDATTVCYDVQRRDDDELSFALRFDADGTVAEIPAPPSVRLPRTGWGIARTVRARDGAVRALQTLEDTPFYARSLLRDGAGADAVVFHESLSLDRFRSTWVQCLLPFRMPRRRSAGRA